MAELATAYIKLIPSMSGSEAQIREDLGSAGESGGQAFASRLKGAVSKLAIGAAIGKAIQSGITEGSALQQSVGGINTLFKEASGKMFDYAQNAYKNAGLSANAYMEQATGFAASLVSSCGGNVNLAAETANTALEDMSDNANKMGTDMESLQFAYQGFAKQNYTMLDNLKLGYGGTKEEMQRLLADAEKLTGVHYNLDNLNDVYQAIHAIQENLNITGTTADEAATTFSGSFGAMKAAAENLLGYMAAGTIGEGQKFTVNLQQAMTDLLETAETFVFGNALPMLGRFVQAIPGVLASGFNSLAVKLREAGVGGIGEFISGFINQLPALAASIGNLAGSLVDYIRNNAGKMKEIAHQCVLAFVDGLKEVVPMSEKTAEKLPGVIEGGVKAVAMIKVASILQPFVSGFGGSILKAVTTAGGHFKDFIGLMKSGGGIFSNLGLMIAQGSGPLANMAAGFVNAGGGLKGFLALAKTLGSTLLSAIFSPTALVIGILAALAGAFMTLWETNDEFRSKIMDTWNGIVESFNGFCQGIVDRINGLGFDFENITEVIGAIWNGFCEMLAPVFEGVWEAIAGIIQGAFDVITGLLDVFIGLFTGNWDQFWQGLGEIAGGIWTGIVGIVSGAWNTLIGLLDWFCSLFGTTWSDVWNSACQTASGIWNGITQWRELKNF